MFNTLKEDCVLSLNMVTCLASFKVFPNLSASSNEVCPLCQHLFRCHLTQPQLHVDKCPAIILDSFYILLILLEIILYNRKVFKYVVYIQICFASVEH